MSFLTATIATVTITAGSIAGCQPPPSDQFQPGIPVVEQAPIPDYPSTGVAAQPAERTTCVVQVREGAPVPNVEQGCRLNVYISDAVIDGQTPEQRCADMGGSLRYSDPKNCVDVDH